MLRRQAGEPPIPHGGQAQPDRALVLWIRPSPNQPRRLGPVHELHHAVVAQQQVVRDVSDRGPPTIRVTPHREEELVLRRREPEARGLLLAPPEEPPKPIAEIEQLRVLSVAHRVPAHQGGLYRMTIHPRSAGCGGAELIVMLEAARSRTFWAVLIDSRRGVALGATLVGARGFEPLTSSASRNAEGVRLPVGTPKAQVRRTPPLPTIPACDVWGATRMLPSVPYDRVEIDGDSDVAPCVTAESRAA